MHLHKAKTGFLEDPNSSHSTQFFKRLTSFLEFSYVSFPFQCAKEHLGEQGAFRLAQPDVVGGDGRKRVTELSSLSSGMIGEGQLR